MSTHDRRYRLLAIVLLIGLLLSPLHPLSSIASASQASQAGETRALAASDITPTNVYRTRITVDSPARWARLEKLDVVVLAKQEDSALVLADDQQLETLARLRFQPQASDELNSLLRAQGSAKAWLRTSLQPLLAQAAALPSPEVGRGAGGEGLRADLRARLHALTPEQQAGIASSISPDDDGDGLTNTQEAWWCTDPLNPDTDSDGISDGEEIGMLKDWMGNRRAGPPGGTPWPSWPFNDTTCPDKDHDSIPNLAERWELGLHMDWESSDHDKFDDGQELFGVTYCPGSNLGCDCGNQ